MKKSKNNKLGGKSIKQFYKDMIKDFIASFDKRMLTRIAIVAGIFVCGILYFYSTWTAKATGEQMAEMMKAATGVSTTATFGAELGSDLMACVIIIVAAIMPLIYIPYLLIPFLAMNMAVIPIIYLGNKAFMPFVLIAVIIKAIMYAYAISFGASLHRNERLKYRYRGILGYNFYDFKSAIYKILGKDDKAEKILTNKEKKKNGMKENIKKVNVYNIFIVVIILAFFLSVSKALLLLAI
ncbi:MAG: hypothetical protein RR810_05985 [Clostridia bacterium]